MGRRSNDWQAFIIASLYKTIYNCILAYHEPSLHILAYHVAWWGGVQPRTSQEPHVCSLHNEIVFNEIDIRGDKCRTISLALSQDGTSMPTPIQLPRVIERGVGVNVPPPPLRLSITYQQWYWAPTLFQNWGAGLWEDPFCISICML